MHAFDTRKLSFRPLLDISAACGTYNEKNNYSTNTSFYICYLLRLFDGFYMWINSFVKEFNAQ